jgi:manganese/zinc/iron transport system permease protein
MTSGVAIVLTGGLVAAACAVLGSFLMLRRTAMLADAISHAVLPGIVAAYFFARGPDVLASFLGATAAGLATVALVRALERTRRIGVDAAIGVVFSGMFALGTLLVTRFFADVHLDADAVLYGNIEFAAQDLLLVGDLVLGPQSLWVMGGLLALNLAAVALLWKELKLSSFDAGLAAALGFSPAVLHYALMTLVSLTAVGAFTAVGAVLAVALLIIPPATAYLITDRLDRLIAIAVAVGVGSAAAGYALALALDSSIAGAIVVVAAAIFAAVAVGSPSHGMVARWLRSRAPA